MITFVVRMRIWCLHAEAQLTLILQRTGCQIFGGNRFGCIRKVRMNQNGET